MCALFGGARMVTKKILIADDSALNRDMITEILGDSYSYMYASDGDELIDMLGSGCQADIILLDINMPHMNGFDVLRIMNERGWIEEIPVVVISAESDLGFLERAYNLGATDYISRPFSAVTIRFRVENTLMLYSKQRQLVRLVGDQVHEREEINDAMINIFGHTVEMRNNESGSHTLNVRNISDALLRRLVALTDRYNLTKRDIATIVALAPLHDIGKMAIPEEILNKPGRLTPEERRVMETHTVHGDEIVAAVQDPHLEAITRVAREICRWHHERWDGHGYPDGLSGDEIPVSAQVVGVADVYDALTSERCYKKAIPHDEALRMMLSGECGEFNPVLVQCLVDVAPQLRATTGRYSFDYEGEAQVLTREMLRERELPEDDRERRLLENERVKKEFFKSCAGGIQFEYDCPARKVTYTDWYRGGMVETVFITEGRGIELLSAEDWDRLVGLLRGTTREQPEITMTALIPVGGAHRWHRITARTVWPLRGERYISVLGQIADIDDEISREGFERAFDDPAAAAGAIGALRSIFDIVRLVDPVDYSVLAFSEDGRIMKTGARCYDTWGRGERCENCSSCEAMRKKNLMTKLETRNDGELYAVISKYMRLRDRECVLELAFSMARAHGGVRAYAASERTRLLLLDFYKDSLTNAYSRMYLDDFGDGLEGADAVALIDVDEFKNINDTYGHQTGDAALRHIAGILISGTEGQGITIRYGGDEFLLIFRSIGESEFFSLLDELRRRVRESVLEGHPDINLGISIGGAYRAGTLSEAIAAADSRMYRNKRKNTV